MITQQLRYGVLVGILLGLCVALTACGKSVTGTYSDQNGAFVLELKSGGAATFTFMGQTASCTYTVDGTNLALTCQGEAGSMAMTIHGDGSLTGPPGTLMPALRKTK